MLRDLIKIFDDRVDASFDALRGNRVADRTFYTASELGDFGLLWVIFGLVRALRGGALNERAAVRAIIATGVESFLVNIILKSFFGRGRPVREIEHPLPIRQPLTSSFPSGHATAAFCGAVLLSDEDPLAALYFASAMVVALSRIYVKIHHASDVVAGVAVGLSLGVIAKRLFPLRRAH
ncbi:MAG TPA: phosphatase PAP2 family protein [Acidimicrobiales bacterium]|nr:phosphatase PAP2 family protein [Acidimicrobiales bacterium]